MTPPGERRYLVKSYSHNNLNKTRLVMMLFFKPLVIIYLKAKEVKYPDK
jgi:hypothetical protein